MIPEIGQMALILALGLALVQGTLPIIGAAKRRLAWMAIARPAAQGQFAFVAIALGCLAWSFYANDFPCSTCIELQLQAAGGLQNVGNLGRPCRSLLLWVLCSVCDPPRSRFSAAGCARRCWRACSACSAGELRFLLFIAAHSNPFDGCSRFRRRRD